MSTKQSRRSRTPRFGGKHLGTAAAAVFALGCGQGQGQGSNAQAPATPSRSTQAVLAPDAPLRQHVEAAGGYATSVDERGVPTFIRATRAAIPPKGLSHESAARFHAQRFSTGLGLKPSALAAVESTLVSDHGAGGVVVHLGQRIGGVEVYRRQLRVLMKQDHSLVSLSGSLQPVTEVVSASAFARTPEEALAAALSHATGSKVAASSVVNQHDDDGDLQRFALAPDSDVYMPHTAVLRKVLLPSGEHLRAAYFIEFYVQQSDGDAPLWRYLVAADDASVIERHNRTAYETFNYRVWADPTDKRPMDGPFQDWTPHPTGRSDWSYPAFIAPNLIPADGFNKNPAGMSDPWLPAGATETNGNNADAYVDRAGKNGATAPNFRAAVTSPGSFDYTYNTLQAPSSKSQTSAAIVQAFYNVNYLHDYWYDSGFTERAGNAQVNNYGRGGRQNDVMYVETQDASGRDNSNMSTGSDGQHPRMQLYLWSGRDSRVLQATGSLEANLPSGSASFGLDNFDTSGEIADTDDGTFPATTDACDTITNDVKGKIALIDRGTCTFKKKAVNAEIAGAIAVLIVNNVNGDPPGMGNGDPMSTMVGIPVLSTSKDSGARIRDALTTGPVSMRFVRKRDIDRDGGLDNTVIFHEWGHYLHHRLATCDSGHQCNAMSEGWGDFVAMHTIARETDDLDGTFGLAIYASAQFTDGAYFGIRRLPYSVDFHKNGYTFKMIGDQVDLPKHMPISGGGPNSEVHNAGEIWTTMMWEAYVGLQKSHRERKDMTFEEVRRLMADYVVTGLQTVPDEATYTEQRDAILAAAGARDPLDEQALSEAFARRGAGTCADSPPKSSSTLTETVEAFKVQPRLVIGTVTLDDSMKSCDMDGVLDAGEEGKLTIELSNGAMKELAGAKLTVSTTTEGATITGATSFDIPTLDPFAGTSVTTSVRLDPKLADPTTLVLKIQPSSDAACENATYERDFKVNYDVALASTSKDDVEAEASTMQWKLTGDQAEDLWARVPLDTSNHAWHGSISEGSADTALESPDLVVSNTEFFKIRFDHRYNFDTFAQSSTTTLYLDGGVVEISQDGGQTWDDIALYADPGYTQTITPIAGNRLGGNPAFADKNFSWPNMDWVAMNFLDKFAGKTVRIRFRLGSGAFFQGATGWDIDNIAFQGVTNTPFAGSTFDAGKCGEGPRGPMPSSGCAVAQRGSSGAGMIVLGLLSAIAGLLVRRRRAPSN